MRTQRISEAQPAQARLHRLLASVFSVAVVASLTISCSLITGLAEPTVPSETPAAETYSPEALAQAEQEVLAVLTAPIAASGPAGEALVRQYLADRQEMLGQVREQIQAGESSLIAPKVARLTGSALLPPPQGQTVDSLAVSMALALKMSAGRGDGVEVFPPPDEGAGQPSPIKITISRQGRTIVAEGEVKASSANAAGDQITETTKIKGTIDACPDAEGHVPLNLTIRLEVSGSVQGVPFAAQANVTGEGTAYVNDEAETTALEQNLTSEYSQQTPGASPGKVIGQYAEVHSARRLDFANPENNSSQSTVGRMSSQAGEIAIENAGMALDYARLASVALLDHAQSLWQNGFCVEVVVTGVEEYNLVDPSSTSTFRATVLHKFEGTELNVPVEAALSGDRSVDPAAKTNAPVDYRYVAGEKPKSTARVALETRSRRGVGKKSVAFTTGETNWRPVSDVAPWSGQVCSLDEPFTLKLSGIIPETYTFQPKSERQGSFSMTQAIGQGCEVHGSGTYAIETTVPEDPTETEADITLSVDGQTMSCPKATVQLPPTVLHILLEPYDDPACK